MQTLVSLRRYTTHSWRTPPRIRYIKHSKEVRLPKSPDTIRSLTVANIRSGLSVSDQARYVILLTVRTPYLNLLTWCSDREYSLGYWSRLPNALDVIARPVKSGCLAQRKSHDSV